jgi:hypothetical protein
MRHGLSDVTRVAQHTLWDDPPEVTSYILPNPALTLYRPLYDQAVVEALLDSRHGPEAVNVQHQMGRTALWWALARWAPGHMEVVRLLTYHKADADQPDMFGVTPRSLAKGKCLAILKVSEAGRARTIVHHGASAATAVKPLPPPPPGTIGRLPTHENPPRSLDRWVLTCTAWQESERAYSLWKARRILDDQQERYLSGSERRHLPRVHLHAPSEGSGSSLRGRSPRMTPRARARARTRQLRDPVLKFVLKDLNHSLFVELMDLVK